MNDIVLTLIGPDRTGLVNAVSESVAAHGGNWLESRMAHLAGKFAGVLRIELPGEQRAALRKALAALEPSGLHFIIEDAAEEPNETAQHTLHIELVGQDRLGIVKEVAHLLATRNVNVEEITTDTESAPMSGERLFRAEIRARAPAEVTVADLSLALEQVASDLMVEIQLAEESD